MTNARILLAGISLAVVMSLAGCASKAQGGPPPSLNAMQRAAMQTKTLEGDAKTAFAAALSVLQDQGWQLDAVDKEGGIIQASSLRKQTLVGPEEDWRASDKAYITQLQKAVRQSEKQGVAYPLWTRWERLTLHVEPWQKNTVQMRISIVECGTLPSGAMVRKKNQLVIVPGKEQSVVVEDAQAYKLLFQDIQKAIFIRQGLKGKGK